MKLVGHVTLGLTWLVLMLLLALSVRGLVDAHSAAASFGVPLTDPATQLYHGVYRSRNLLISAIGIIFLLASMWRALAILTTAAIALPLFDIVLLQSMSMRVTWIHPATLVVLLLVAALQWLRIHRSRPLSLSAETGAVHDGTASRS